MSVYIKYKRINITLKESEINTFFDNLIIDGWNIIYYNEFIIPYESLNNEITENSINMTIVLGKKRELLI